MTIHATQSDNAERELIMRAQRGDRAAFKALYESYRDRVYNIIFYSMGDELASEDILQIVFIKIYRGLPGFRFEASLATWIYRITLNECLNQQQRRGAQYVPFEAILGSDDEFDSAAPPDIEHADKERREIIQRALMELPPKLRDVIALKYLEGLSYEEIAAVLGCAPGTVASRLSRALEKLETRLRPLRRLL
jgi:RNA polymerase sigma-70 factor (ECF subfamily)